MCVQLKKVSFHNILPCLQDWGHSHKHICTIKLKPQSQTICCQRPTQYPSPIEIKGTIWTTIDAKYGGNIICTPELWTVTSWLNNQTVIFKISVIVYFSTYRIAENFDRGKFWRMLTFQIFDGKYFDRWSVSFTKHCIALKFWQVKFWWSGWKVSKTSKFPAIR